MNGVPLAYTASIRNHMDNDCAPIDGVIASPSLVQSISDCDCAPVDHAVSQHPDTAVDKTTPYLLTPQLYTATLPAGFTLAFGPYSPAGPVVLNQPALERLLSFQTPQSLEEAVDFTLAEQNLLLPNGRAPRRQSAPPTTLTAWLHITNACNLDCPYCYVRKSNARMTEAVGRQVVQTIFQTALRHGFRTVVLKYAGGEAALHFRLVQTLHTCARTLARQTGLDLQAVILTNGTPWTPSMIGWLADQHIQPVISLDGTAAAHDALRPTRAGQGSFDRIERAIDRGFLPAGLRPKITITVTGQNAHAAADAVAWAVERNLPFSLNFYRQNPLSLSRQDLVLEEERIIAGMRRAYKVVEQALPRQPPLEGLLDHVRLDYHAHTCGAGQNYLVFSHTGQVAQCQMLLEHSHPLPHNGDPLRQVAQGQIPIISVEDKAGCRTCPWRYRCTGGCPLETYRATGRFDVQSPHCNIYRALLPEMLRLAALRVMVQTGVWSPC